MGQGDCETWVQHVPGDKNTNLLQKQGGQLSPENVAYEIPITRMSLF